MLKVIPVLAVCAMSQAALAQSVYKCTAQGKVEYRDQPCAGDDGVALRVPAAPAPLAAAVDTTRGERDTLVMLEKLRQARELREERDARAQARDRRSAASQHLRCARLRLRLKWANEDHARMAGPKAEAARIKMRRDAEVLAVECPA
jgi:hypothetical protein